ncbi:MAG: hypothetical protein ACOC9Y_03845 [Chloroflexota bacterium]
MSMTQSEIDEARTVGRKLAHQMIDDPDFRRQLKEDSAATLVAAGLPEEVVPDFLREFPVSPEVSGYALEADCSGGCSTCFLITVNQ